MSDIRDNFLISSVRFKGRKKPFANRNRVVVDRIISPHYVEKEPMLRSDFCSMQLIFTSLTEPLPIASRN